MQEPAFQPNNSVSNEIGAVLPLLQLVYRGETALFVPEYAEVDVRLHNPSASPLRQVSLWLGQERLRSELTLPPGSTYSFPYNVRDLVGEQAITVRVGEAPRASATVMVQPLKLSQAEMDWIRLERLPALLARLDAPNALRLSYDSDSAEEPPFHYFSADYTAIRLRFFCHKLLEDGLAERLFKRLDFVTPENRQTSQNFVPGGVRWNETVQDWLARPEDTGLVHRSVDLQRDFVTLPNVLLLYFTRILVAENRRLAQLVAAGAPASARLKATLAEFEGYARSLEQGLLTHRRLLQPLLFRLDNAGFDPLERQTADAIARACQRAANPAYIELATLWQLFNWRFARLPQEEELSLQVGLQPASRVYELWAACEIAVALNLTLDDAPGLESAIFKGKYGLTLYYNQGYAGGWYSASRPSARLRLPRPDLRLEVNGQTRLLLDVKYRSAPGNDARAHPDDLYRMLAYMNDFSISQGVIIFPGSANNSLPQVTAFQNENKTQVAGEINLRPPGQVNLEQWQSTLNASLNSFLKA
ncbi:MAG TPA: hypothetical protein VH186_36020 [Chloroflexia bacterium]|nr:hypothetical protein [Chloroflexia bacterium]